MDFEIVPTEYTDGAINGALYTSKVRIVARSPDAFMFVGYGLNVTKRDNKYHHATKIASDAKRATLIRDDIKERIEKVLGEGSHAAVLKTLDKKGMGTVLLDGGGDRFSLPRKEAFAIKDAAYWAVSPTTISLPEGSKTCIQCGTKLKPKTDHHRLGHYLMDNHPRTVEDCQRLTNYPVISIRGYGMNQSEDRWPFVEWFETWNGETYEDDTFCNDRCAVVYGRRAACELPRLEAGGEAPKRVYVPREDHDHYEAAAERSRESIERSFGQKIDPKFKI